ncbi:MAG: hypothetical protein AAB576_03380, partial [Elusimicrobiota bacterium]
VLFPGELAVAGKCNITPPCRFLDGSETPGKSGKPTNFPIGTPPMQLTVNLVDKFFNVATNHSSTTVNWDTDPPAVMPKVKLSLPQDPLIIPIAAADLIYGAWTFPLDPLTALSTYTAYASTTPDSAADAASALSSELVVYPGPAHHLHFSTLPSSATAGDPISYSLTAHDKYHNLLSTGPNIYMSTVTLSSEIFPPPQNASFEPNEFAFGLVHEGVRSVSTGIILKKAGIRSVRASQKNSTLIHTEVPGYSVKPTVEISAGPAGAVAVSPGPTSQQFKVRAGSNLQRGYREFNGQVSDIYNNPLSSPATVYIEIVSVAGSSGTLLVISSGVPTSIGQSTTVVSDVKGRIGKNADVDNL